MPPLFFNPQAVAIGGGYIGLECAAALALNGLDVTMVSRFGGLLTSNCATAAGASECVPHTTTWCNPMHQVWCC